MHVPLFPLCYFFVTNFVYPPPLPWWRHKQYSFGLVFPRNAKKTHGDQSMPKIFHSVWKETTHKSSKVAATKSIFSTDTTYFDQCFLFHAITGRHYFLYKFNVTLSFFFQPPCCCVLWNSFWKEVHVISPLSLQQHYSAHKKGPK